MVVNILAKGSGWDKIPEKPEGVVYGVNDAFLRTPCDITFHMHDLNVWENRPESESSTKLIVMAANRNPRMEFYTIRPYSKIPHAKPYPLDEIVKHFNSNYFTNGISFIIAYAIWKGATVINLYGVNMTVEEEYIAQKPNVEYWLGRAEGMGIEVNYQWEYTSLKKSKDGLLYGYFFDQWRL